MNIVQAKRYLDDILNPVDYQLEVINLNHSIYYIWGLKNARIKVIPEQFRNLRPEKSQVDIFVNGQYISPNVYLIDYKNEFLRIKFFREEFQYELEESDEIIIRGDIEKYA